MTPAWVVIILPVIGNDSVLLPAGVRWVARIRVASPDDRHNRAAPSAGSSVYSLPDVISASSARGFFIARA
jgi:hypothetical protein